MHIVLDTNLLVGLWMRDPRLPSLALAWEEASLPWATCTALFDEALDVLMRPEVRRDAAYGGDEVERWLRRGWRSARWLGAVDAGALSRAPVAPDPGDQFLWDLLAAHPELRLWTRDKRLLQDRGMRGRVLPPPEPAAIRTR